MGRFTERTVTVGRTEYSFVFPDTLKVAEQQRTAGVLHSTARYVHSLFGRELGSRYTVAVLPKTSDGDEIQGSSWGTGQGATLWPITPQRLHLYASNLIHAYSRDQPFASRIRNPDEFWLVEGVATFFGWRAVARAGLVSEEVVVQDLAVSYLTLLSGLGSRNLEAVYSGAMDRGLAAEVVSPLVLALLDRELQSKDGVSLDQLMPTMFRRWHAVSLWDAVRGVSKGDWSTFRSRYVRGQAVAPVEDLFNARPTRMAPEVLNEARTELTLAYTGNTRGYLETCGCKVNQSGGVARRATVLKEIRRKHRNTVFLELGGMLPDPEIDPSANFLSREETKFYLSAVDHMSYDAACIGTTDLAAGWIHLKEMLRDRDIPITVCNVRGPGPAPWPSYRLVRKGGLVIGVIGVFEPPSGTQRGNGLEECLLDTDLSPPVQRVAAVMDSMENQADVSIVIGRIRPTTVRSLVERCPQIDVIITTETRLPRVTQGADGRRISLDESCGFLDSTLVLYAFQRQYGVGVAGLRLGPTNRIASAESHTVSLGPDVPDDHGMRTMLASFYRRVGALPEAGTSVQSLFPNDSLRQWSAYAGAEACQACHESEYDQWATTPHAMAYKTLLERHRHYQPRCVSCHVVGYGTKHGYKVGDSEVPLGNVQCEVCHGPGRPHVLAPETSNIRRAVPESVCLACHTPDHSDHFVYRDKIWKVDHRSPGPASAESPSPEVVRAHH